MALNLFDLALQQENARRAAATAAQAALSAAKATARTAETSRATAALALAAADAALAGLRTQHPQTPAAVAALAVALAEATVVQRSTQASLHNQAVLAATASQDRASAEQAALQAGAAWQQAQAALALARSANERRRALIDDALTLPPLAAVPAKATAALAGPEHAAARQRVEGALPTALRERARDRAAQATALARSIAARRAAAQAAVDAEAEAGGQPGSRVPRLQRALAAADAALAAYTGSAAARLTGAVATLQQLAARLVNPLSPAQQAQLNDLQGSARPDAAAAENAQDDAAVALAGAAAVLRGERIRTRITDPGGDMAVMEADAANHATLAQARSDFDAAQTAFNTARSAYTTAMRRTLALWQAEVPDALWSEAATFWAADDLLRALQAAPAALVSASSTAAAALLVALEADAPVQQRSADAAAALRHEDAFAQALGLATPDLAAAAQRGLLASAAWLLP